MPPTFADLGVPAPVCDALATRGIVEPLAIQVACIADGLEGRDIVAQAPTGSGKTLAFGIPLLVDLPRAESRRPTALILSPTRELAQQIAAELAPLAAVMQRDVGVVVGGVNETPQRRQLDRGVDILVATPGRLEDLAGRGLVKLSAVEHMVVDEADRMADMGFLPAVERILEDLPAERQLVLFSATVDKALEQLAAHQTDAVRHRVGAAPDETGEVEHHFWSVGRDDRVQTLADVVRATGSTIIFTRTRHGADRVARQLGKVGVRAVALHGGRSQSQRQQALGAFTSGHAPALVATDVAARGIHVDSVQCVVHADPAEDAATYIHRSGRTGRTGNDGTVVSIIEPALVKKARKQLSGLAHKVDPTAPDIARLLQRRSTMTIKTPARSAPAAATSAHDDTARPKRAEQRDDRRRGGTRGSGRSDDRPRSDAGNDGDRRRRGVVKSYDTKRGFGFIERPGRDDLFVHASNAPHGGLEAGQNVSYGVGNGRRGDEARAVRVESGAPRRRNTRPERRGHSGPPSKSRRRSPGRPGGKRPRQAAHG